MLARAALSSAHARLARRRDWVLTEKGLLERAGLGDVQTLLRAVGDSPEALSSAVAAVSATVELEPLRPR